MKPHGLLLAGLVFATGLLFAPAANAQLLTRWFGSKTPDKNPPAKTTQTDPRRITEVNVEVAWLADPVTFPYYLEAHATSSQLEIRGYVPSKEVREHALRIAQVHSSVAVVDAIKEHPSLLVKTSQMAPQQLHSSVISSLRVALPKQYQQLKAECGADGKVFVVGTVNSYEEKMAVSHSLRRLHGCTSVMNLTTLPVEVAQTPKEKMPIVKTSNSTEKGDGVAEKKPWFSLKAPAPTKEEPPLLDRRKPALQGPEVVVEAKKPAQLNGPISNPEPMATPKAPSAVAKMETPKRPPEPKLDKLDTPKTLVPTAELQKRIQAVCPQVKNVGVEFTSAKDVTITLEIRTESELNPTAERIFEMPELQNYRPELQFKIIAP